MVESPVIETAGILTWAMLSSTLEFEHRKIEHRVLAYRCNGEWLMHRYIFFHAQRHGAFVIDGLGGEQTFFEVELKNGKTT